MTPGAASKRHHLLGAQYDRCFAWLSHEGQTLDQVGSLERHLEKEPERDDRGIDACRTVEGYPDTLDAWKAGRSPQERSLAYGEASGEHNAIERGAPDAAIIKSLNKASEAKSLLAVAATKVEALAQKVEAARLQVAEHERGVDRAIGCVVAVIAEGKVQAFRDAWETQIAAGAEIYAFGARLGLLRVANLPALSTNQAPTAIIGYPHMTKPSKLLPNLSDELGETEGRRSVEGR